MRAEPLAILLTSDIAAKARGRSFRASELQKYLTSGCGWVPANLAIDAFGSIVTPNPFGSVGDLRLMPDPDTEVSLELHEGGAATLYLSDIHRPDGQPWECDARSFLKTAIAQLQEQAGLRVVASFEHEFMLLRENSSPVNTPFSLEAFLDESPLGTQLVAALTDAGLEPEMWLPEFGRDQFEITLAPASALTAADRAIYLREIVRHVAAGLGKKVTFAPLIEANGGGNGVHVHLSLQGMDGEPVSYDPARPGKLSRVAGSFAAGILRRAEEIQLLAAASPLSYERLAPHRWSAGGVFLGENNREALLRICPLFETPGADHKRQFNLEYRAADATANPWLLLGCLIKAGLEGVVDDLPAPPVVCGDTDEMSAAELQELGVRALPGSFTAAIDRFAASDIGGSWFSQQLAETIIAVKRAEDAQVAEMVPEDVYRSYAATY